MKGNASDLALLIAKQREGNLTPEELKQLNEWALSSEANREVFNNLTDPDKLQQLLREYYEAHKDLSSLNEQAPVIGIKVTRYKKYFRYGVAAAVIFLITTCAYLFFFSYNTPPTLTESGKPAFQDVQPGGLKATLILADKSIVDLTGVPEGVIARQGETAIKKMSGGNLRYEGSSTTGLNTLMTPRGGFYNLTFSDGTRVWLNAESSIRYPVTFSGKERKVELVSGEAYFEVAKNAKMPFIVQSGPVAVQVLGTRFNFQSYNNEAGIATTLLEGSVRISVNENNAAKILSPGQQALVKRNKSVIDVQETDAESFIAWVNGKFYFHHATLQEVTRQLERWYDVAFVLEEGVVVEAGSFQGDIERGIPLSKMLANLAHMGDFQFKIREKTVIVSKAMK